MQGEYGSFYIPSEVHHFKQYIDDVIPNIPLPFRNMVVHGETPTKPSHSGVRGGIYNQTESVIWNIYEGDSSVDIPQNLALIPVDFDGEWVLYRWHSEERLKQAGAAAIKMTGENFQVLHEIKPRDDSHYGGPLVARVVGGGHAYLSMRYESLGGSVDNAIIDVNLTTGERREILNVTHSILHMDASDDYLVLNAVIDGESGTWVWNRSEWLRVGDAGLNPVVGGEWVVYLEPGAASNGRDVLVGIHVPTLTRHVLIEERDNALLEWDSDGEYVIIKAQANRHFATALRYSGAQLYWIELPEP